MPELTRDFAAGNYRFIPAVFQYSSGAVAHSGFEIERVRFDRLIPLSEGFARAAKHIQAAGRPLTSFCACELRSPAAFTEAGFLAFNRHYVKTLAEWGIFDGTSNPAFIGAQAAAPLFFRIVDALHTAEPDIGDISLRPPSSLMNASSSQGL